MDLEVKHTCPFGHTCQRIVDNKIEKCVLYLELKSINEISKEEVTTSNCAMNWNVILQHESNKRIFAVQEATNDFKNEMVKGQSESTAILTQVALMSNNQKLLGY